MFLRNIVVYPTVECTHIAMLIKPSLLLLLQEKMRECRIERGEDERM